MKRMALCHERNDRNQHRFNKLFCNDVIIICHIFQNVMDCYGLQLIIVAKP